MDGFINLLKPPGMTSSDAVVRVRKLLPRGVRVGHGGTLDPDAAGVLPICVGRATRLFDYMIDKRKRYITEMTLGVSTDTQDASGKVVRARPVEASREDVERALSGFIGDISQTPPAYSAVKLGGERMYALARKGEAPVAEARAARVYDIAYLRQSGPASHMLAVDCGKGVYIRTLVNDIGEALGCGAHMSFLLRERAGYFGVEDALTPDELSPERLDEMLIPMDAPLAGLPEARLPESFRTAAQNGNVAPRGLFAPPPGLNVGEAARVYVGDSFAGIGALDGEGRLRFKAMLLAAGGE